MINMFFLFVCFVSFRFEKEPESGETPVNPNLLVLSWETIPVIVQKMKCMWNLLQGSCPFSKNSLDSEAGAGHRQSVSLFWVHSAAAGCTSPLPLPAPAYLASSGLYSPLSHFIFPSYPVLFPNFSPEQLLLTMKSLSVL